MNSTPMLDDFRAEVRAWLEDNCPAEMREPVGGESDAGLRMTQFPAASAGAAFQLAMGNGKFHGTMHATTPIG